MIYHCCDPRRRELTLEHATLNGIDFLEVLDGEAPPGVPRQRTLLVRFLKPAPSLTRANVEIAGGVRVTGIEVEWVTHADAPDPGLVEPALAAYLAGIAEPDRVLVLRTNASGDYATYTLRLVSAPGALTPPDGIDRVLSEVEFSFKVECATDFDCAPQHACPQEPTERPAISYLAKDYRSFRRLMLARMAEIMPAWQDRSAADLGITLVEMLAYTADRLSYAQDAVATEAYLGTARRRSSVRRHARIVDYHMHDGANARTWVHVEVDTGGLEIRAGRERFLTRISATDDDPWYETRPMWRQPTIAPSDESAALSRGPLVFEPLHDRTLNPAHNRIDFYAWGDAECCLPAGATRATLEGDLPELSTGDVLIFEERIGPRTGRAADADPGTRHPVMLTAVQANLTDALTGASITEIRWAEEDALPFPFCISSRLDDDAGGGLATRVSHALGNNVLADHGRSIADEELGVVAHPHLELALAASGGHCERREPVPVPPRFRPSLAEGPVTQEAPWPTADPPTSAFAAADRPIGVRRPAVHLRGTTQSTTRMWEARRDLLQSFPQDPHFVVETERDGAARLRFGDDRNGLRPAAGTAFTATYRIGNGTVGNLGADALHHVVTPQGGITSVRNPLAARGGVDPESMQEVREAAPYAYRRQERAVTPEDYADVARRHPDVQRAAATFRWNGHGHTVFVTVDRFGGRPVTPEFADDLRSFLERFRMAGYDLAIDMPRFVPIELGLFVCVSGEHFRAGVRAEVLAVLSAGTLPDGTRGFFHPDRFSFGDPAHLSAIYAVVMGVAGVTSVHATRFHRQGRPDPVPLLDGVLEVGRLEIAQLENDPNFPERGSIELEMGGGT